MYTGGTKVGAALEIFPPEIKKTLWFHVHTKIETKKNEQAEPTEQLGTSPKLLIFDFSDGDQNTRRGPCYMSLPLRSPGLSKIVARLHRLCVQLRC